MHIYKNTCTFENVLWTTHLK